MRDAQQRLLGELLSCPISNEKTRNSNIGFHYPRCHQLMVNYSKIPWHEFKSHPHDLDSISWDVSDTKLLINSEGCGYPPHVNCSEFAKKYG